MKALVIGILLLLAVGAAGLWYLSNHTHVSYGYEVVAEFTSMPESDDNFAAWLRDQPGVAGHTVDMFREGNSIRISFIQSHTPAGDPPFPDLDRKAIQLGYRGGSFRNVERP